MDLQRNSRLGQLEAGRRRAAWLLLWGDWRLARACSHLQIFPSLSPDPQRVSAHFATSVEGQAWWVLGFRESHPLSPPGVCTEAPQFKLASSLEGPGRGLAGMVVLG